MKTLAVSFLWFNSVNFYGVSELVNVIGQKSVFLLILFVFILASGCIGQDKIAKPTEGAPDWRDYELSDVSSGKSIKISDFKGKPVLLESFAVWCPTCLQQQKEIKKLKQAEGDAIIHISLDTDPNEDEDIVKNHKESNGFDWYFVVSPIEFTQSLIEEFGIGFVNAPGAPVVLICEDQSARMLGRGVKSVDELKSEIEKGC